MEAAFVHLLDFMAREMIETCVTNSDEIIEAGDAQKMADITCACIDRHDVKAILKERIRVFLSVEKVS